MVVLKGRDIPHETHIEGGMMPNNNEVSVDAILDEIGVENPNLNSLELDLAKAIQQLANADTAVDNARKVLEDAKDQPNLRETAREKVVGMLKLEFQSSAIIEALRAQFPTVNNSKKTVKNSGVSLDDATRAQVTEYILKLEKSFKTSDIWDDFSKYKRPDIFSVIAGLVKEGKLKKRGEKRGVHYYVTEHAPKENAA